MKKTFVTILFAFCLFVPVPNTLAQGTVIAPTASVIQGVPAVTLISLGAEPRQKLRYRFSGNAELVTMELSMAMGIELAGRTFPKQNMPLFVQTVEIIPTSINEGGMNYRYTVSKMKIEPVAGVDPAVLRMLQESTQGMVGLTGTGQVNALGVSTVGNVSFPVGANPKMVEQANQLNERISQVVSPLPVEAVGVGAQWKVELPFLTSGIAMTAFHTFEILSIDGDIVKVSVKAQMETRKQLADIPNLPLGVRAVVDSMKVSCEGTNEIDLKVMSPVSTLDLKLDQEAAVIQPGQPDQKMRMNTEMQLRIKPSELKAGQVEVVGEAEVIEGQFAVPANPGL